jgi:hypothetical protein
LNVAWQLLQRVLPPERREAPSHVFELGAVAFAVRDRPNRISRAEMPTRLHVFEWRVHHRREELPIGMQLRVGEILGEATALVIYSFSASEACLGSQ